jgi:hypothetical protein
VCHPASFFEGSDSWRSRNDRNDAAVLGSGLTLTRVASGVVTTDTGCLFATYPTLLAVGNYINALGNGWSAYVPNNQYALWPSADLRVAGALNCAKAVVAELKMHVIEVLDHQMDPGRLDAGYRQLPHPVPGRLLHDSQQRARSLR